MASISEMPVLGQETQATGLYSLWLTALSWGLHTLIVLSCLVAFEHLRHVAKHAGIAVRRILGRGKPVDRYLRAELPDALKASSSYPKVAVQLPMFNELHVCEGVIDAACAQSWPASRLKVQVLDDSDCVQTRARVEAKVAEWQRLGVNVELVRRTHRQGYKAGALRDGMELLQAEGFKYVAILDADFRPEADWLQRMVPYLEANPRVAFTQSRWRFLNSEESLLTKAQEIALNYHFACEQTVHFDADTFFNFNGTGGVWRMEAIADVGGWLSRTTVEDMDLSLRTYLADWQAVYLEDVACPSELPASLFAYRKQQHRWTCGPMQLVRKVLPELRRSRLPLHKKLDVLYCYFGIGKFLTHVVCLAFYCVLLPLVVLTPELRVPTWAVFQMPLVCTVCTCIYTPRSWQYAFVYVLFNNAMAVVKLWAVVVGLLGLPRANEWVVTTKLGSGAKAGAGGGGAAGPQFRLYPGELAMGAYLVATGVAGLASGTARLGVAAFLLLQGATFVAFGLNAVDHSFRLLGSGGAGIGGKVGAPLGGILSDGKRSGLGALAALSASGKQLLLRNGVGMKAVASLPSFAKKENDAKV